MVEGLAVDLVHVDGSALVMVRGEIDLDRRPCSAVRCDQ